MANEKRDRQRANREAKQAALKKAQRRQEMISRGKRIGIWALVGIVLFALATLLFGSNDDAAAAVVVALAGWAA